MYALEDAYEGRVIDFIQRIKMNDAIHVEVNGLSTQLFGEYDLMMDVLREEMRASFEDGKVVFVLKIAGSELTREKLPEILR